MPGVSVYVNRDVFCAGHLCDPIHAPSFACTGPSQFSNSADIRLAVRVAGSTPWAPFVPGQRAPRHRRGAQAGLASLNRAQVLPSVRQQVARASLRPLAAWASSLPPAALPDQQAMGLSARTMPFQSTATLQKRRFS
jgi:hypothetical protein